MKTLLRTACVALALLVVGAAPALAQQAGSGGAATTPAPSTGQPGTAETLKKDLQKMAEQAKKTAEDVIAGKTVVLTTDQLAAIAAGAVVGAIAVDLAGGGGLATLTGAAVGGVIGHWLYTQPSSVVPAR